MNTTNQTAATSLLDDPLAFARTVFERTLEDDPRLARHAPAEFAPYDAAPAELKRLHPGGGAADPLELLDKHALAWGQAAFLGRGPVRDRDGPIAPVVAGDGDRRGGALRR